MPGGAFNTCPWCDNPKPLDDPLCPVCESMQGEARWEGAQMVAAENRAWGEQVTDTDQESWPARSQSWQWGPDPRPHDV